MVPVHVRQDVSLQMIHGPPLLALVNREGLQGVPVVVKLGQDTAPLSGDQGAGSVAIVLKTNGKVDITKFYFLVHSGTIYIYTGKYLTAFNFGAQNIKLGKFLLFNGFEQIPAELTPLVKILCGELK